MFERERELLSDLADEAHKMIELGASDRIQEAQLELIKAYRHSIISDYYDANFKSVRDNEISMDTFLLMQSNLVGKIDPTCGDEPMNYNEAREIAVRIMGNNKVEVHKNVSKPRITQRPEPLKPSGPGQS